MSEAAESRRSGVSWEWIANGCIGLLMAVGGWFLLTMWNDQQSLKRDIYQLERTTSSEFVRRDDLQEVKQALNRIEDKLDRKRDK